MRKESGSSHVVQGDPVVFRNKMVMMMMERECRIHQSTSQNNKHQNACECVFPLFMRRCMSMEMFMTKMTMMVV